MNKRSEKKPKKKQREKKIVKEQLDVDINLSENLL